MGGLLKGILLNLQPFKRAIFFPSSPGSHSGLAGGVVESFSVCPLHWKPSLGLVLTAAEGWQHRLPCVFAGIKFSMLYYTNVSPLTLTLAIYCFTFSVVLFSDSNTRLSFCALAPFSSLFVPIFSLSISLHNYRIRTQWCHRLNPDSEVAPSSAPPLQRDFCPFFAFVFAVCFNIEDV